jgi:cell division protein FtsI/penicillin-binding protein 2
MHFLDSIHSADGKLLKKYEPQVETKIDFKPENLSIIHQGMYQVTSGKSGTLRNVFKNYPIKVAAKSGTAQQTSYRSEHTVFVGFAPLDDPQISVTVLIPFGNDSATAPAPNIAKKVISDYLQIDSQPQKTQYNTLSE